MSEKGRNAVVRIEAAAAKPAASREVRPLYRAIVVRLAWSMVLLLPWLCIVLAVKSCTGK